MKKLYKTHELNQKQILKSEKSKNLEKIYKTEKFQVFYTNREICHRLQHK